MTTKRLRILVLLLLASVVLVAACTRSASTPPAATSEETPSGQGDDTQATMDAVRSAILTQTAQVEDTTADDDATPTPEVEPVETEESTEETPDPTATPIPGGQTEYIVKPGDWIWKIARSFGVDPQDIIDFNGLTSPSQISPGLVLKIPAASTQPTETEEPIGTPGTGTPEPSGIIHVVKAGEWIWQIARIYGVDPQAIIDANDLVDPTLIYPGQELKIP